MRRSEDEAVQRICPAMVRALDAPWETTLRSRTQAGATMPADVIKSFDRSGFAPDDDDAFAGDLSKKVVAGFRDVVRASRADPTFEEERIELAAKELRVCVVASRQCFGKGAQGCLLLLGIRLSMVNQK